MRLGLFLAIALALATVVGFFAPYPGTFGPSSGIARRPKPISVRCLRLTYDPVPSLASVPAHIRLDTIRASAFDRFGTTGYLAKGWPGYGGFEAAGWRAAARDTIDIGWHHSPIIRLQLPDGPTADTLRGRGGWWNYSTIYGALANEGHFDMRATEIPCPASG